MRAKLLWCWQPNFCKPKQRENRSFCTVKQSNGRHQSSWSRWRRKCLLRQWWRLPAITISTDGFRFWLTDKFAGIICYIQPWNSSPAQSDFTNAGHIHGRYERLHLLVLEHLWLTLITLANHVADDRELPCARRRNFHETSRSNWAQQFWLWRA